MPSPILYSTNVYLKWLIQFRFRNNSHFVWCSEYFDSKTQPKYSLGAVAAPSSNPADIYKQLKADIENKDRHSYKIIAQKASLTKLAIDWEQAGHITRSDKDEIVFMVNNASFDDWRPLLYLIPRSLVAKRLRTVPIQQRASYGMEFIIENLQPTEFDVIEL